MLKVKGRVGMNEIPPIRERSKLALLAIALSSMAAGVLFERFYFVREWLLFVVFAALLVFLTVNLALLGIVVHAAVRSVLSFLRTAKTEIVQQEVGPTGRRWRVHVVRGKSLCCHADGLESILLVVLSFLRIATGAAVPAVF